MKIYIEKKVHIPVLMYHDIRNDDYSIDSSNTDNGPYIQKVKDFNSQIETLKSKNFETIAVSGLNEKVNNIKSEKEFNKRTVALTFDDGDESNFKQAYRILKKNNLIATFFITTDFIGKPEMVTWEQIREMHNGGMEIGSHTVSHRIPTFLSEKELIYELSESKKILEDGIGAEVKSLSIPTGFTNKKISKIAKKCGYSYVCTSCSGYNNINGIDFFSIRRIAIKRSTKIEEFEKYIKCKKSQIIKKLLIEMIKRNIIGAIGPVKYNQIRSFILKSGIQKL